MDVRVLDLKAMVSQDVATDDTGIFAHALPTPPANHPVEKRSNFEHHTTSSSFTEHKIHQ